MRRTKVVWASFGFVPHRLEWDVDGVFKCFGSPTLTANFLGCDSPK